MNDKGFTRAFSHNVKNTTFDLGQRTLSFFGISEPNDEEVKKWNERRLRFTLQKFGNINTQKLKHEKADLKLCSNNYNFEPVNETEDNGEATDDIPLEEPVNATTTNVNNNSFSNKRERLVSFRRGKSAPGTINRQISLNGNLMTTYFDELNTSHHRINAIQAISKVITSSEKLSFKSIPDNQNQVLKEKINEESLMDFSAKSHLKNLHEYFVFRFICCLMKHNQESESICSKIDECYQYRPYFSYWITCVQIIIFMIGCFCYGFAPIELKLKTEYRKDLELPNGVIRSVCWYEHDNFWIGPHLSDLIKMGAKYSPCMRFDINWQVTILKAQIAEERKSVCCIRNDDGGCFQTVHQCFPTLYSYYSWKSISKMNSININRTSGPVCGQDPRFCLHPQSMPPFEWSDDITQWAICETSVPLNGSLRSSNPHMTCEITGRPCCAGIKGECIITSQEHCKFIRGYYHPEASLCSQVNCLGDVCGMLNFEQNSPNQIYRLFTSLFIHVGIIHLIITVVLQLLFLRDFEKLMGWHRTFFIYIFSGVFGNLISAIFLPYKVEAGPSSAHFAFLSIIIIELFKNRYVIASPLKVLVKYSLFTVFLLILGLLPWFDNYAHISGLISGVLLSFVFLPFLGLPNENLTGRDRKKCRRRVIMWRSLTIFCCGLLWLCLFVGSIILFHKHYIVRCDWCKYITCIPFTDTFCQNDDVNITSYTPCLRLS